MIEPTVFAPPSELAQSWARAHAGVTISLNIVALVVFAGRIYTRCFPSCRLTADDYVISIAWVLTVLESLFLLLTVPYAFGRDPESITLRDAELLYRNVVIAQTFWAWGMAAVKNSIALMLLRFESNVRMRRFLWGNIVLQIFLALYNMLAQLLQCVPIEKEWDFAGKMEGKCWSLRAIKTSFICQAVLFVGTDIILALMPISFLRKVRRPLRERVSVGCLMGLGVLASAASLAKLEASLRLGPGPKGDRVAVGIQMVMWSVVEELTGFICACLPCLRSPVLRRCFGGKSTQKPIWPKGYHNMGTRGRMEIGSGSKTYNSRAADKGMKLKNLWSRSGHGDVDGSTLSNGGSKIREVWCTPEMQAKYGIRPEELTDSEQDKTQSSWYQHNGMDAEQRICQGM